MTTRFDIVKARLFDQFKDAPNILSYLQSVFERMDDTDQLLSGLALERWIDTSQGVWLDNCGDIVGIYPRPPQFVSDDLVFTCKAIGEPDDVNKGFADITQIFGGRLSAIGGLFTDEAVNDDTYRIYVKAKAYSTSKKTAERNVVMFCHDIFGVDVDVTTPEQYLMLATPTAPVNTQTRRIIERLAPIAAGVRFRVEIV